MIPGTPMIATYYLKDDNAHLQCVVIFDGLYDGEGVTYNPRTNKRVTGKLNGLMTIDGREVDPTNPIITKWEDLLPPDMYITNDFCAIRQPHTDEMAIATKRHINAAIARYEKFKAEPSDDQTDAPQEPQP